MGSSAGGPLRWLARCNDPDGTSDLCGMRRLKNRGAFTKPSNDILAHVANRGAYFDERRAVCVTLHPADFEKLSAGAQRVRQSRREINVIRWAVLKQRKQGARAPIDHVMSLWDIFANHASHRPFPSKERRGQKDKKPPSAKLAPDDFSAFSTEGDRRKAGPDGPGKIVAPFTGLRIPAPKSVRSFPGRQACRRFVLRHIPL